MHIDNIVRQQKTIMTGVSSEPGLLALFAGDALMHLVRIDASLGALGLRGRRAGIGATPLTPPART